MDVAIDAGHFDLSQDNDTVGDRATTNKDEVTGEVERNELFVAQMLDRLPHARLMLVPMVARVYDRSLELFLHTLERPDRMTGRFVGYVEISRLVGCC